MGMVAMIELQGEFFFLVITSTLIKRDGMVHFVLGSLVVSAALANPNGLGGKPPMGWRSWNFMKANVSQERILAQVAAITIR